jgi:hypothetical protein
MDLLQLAINARDQMPAYRALQFAQTQLWELLYAREQLQGSSSQLQEHEQLAAAGTPGSQPPPQQQHQQQQPPPPQQQQQRRIITRNKARYEQEQAELLGLMEEYWTERQMQGAEHEQLLTTAVVRMHPQVTSMLCKLPTATQLPGDAILWLLQHCIVHKSPAPTVLRVLLELAAAADQRAAEASAATATAAAPASQEPFSSNSYVNGSRTGGCSNAAALCNSARAAARA